MYSEWLLLLWNPAKAYSTHESHISGCNDSKSYGTDFSDRAVENTRKSENCFIFPAPMNGKNPVPRRFKLAPLSIVLNFVIFFVIICVCYHLILFVIFGRCHLWCDQSRVFFVIFTVFICIFSLIPLVEKLV